MQFHLYSLRREFAFEFGRHETSNRISISQNASLFPSIFSPNGEIGIYQTTSVILTRKYENV